MTANVDELHAFRLARVTAHERGWPWRPPYFINLDEGEWQVHAENEYIIRIDAQRGELVPEPGQLDPLLALTHAKSYALDQGLGWKPAFSLDLHPEGWEVGACQSRFGGQTHIYVSHQGDIIRHHVNSK